MKSMPHKF